MERVGDDVAGGDARTLSFAAYRIDPPLLDQLLRYERALLGELEQGWSPDAMAAAHRKALAASGLSQDVVERALDLAVTGKAVSLQSNSNYGNALASFVRRELPSVTRRTTVLIIGDGRNNQNPPNVWALREIRRKARRVVWICPEERRAWGVGDSEMDLYARVCDQVVVVQSLSDLDRLADQLVPAGAH